MSGFTIIELLLATSIFSLVLLGALAGFLRTGNLFYKGVSLTQTQSVTKQILDDVSSNISGSAAVQAPNQNPSSGYTYYCIGNVRYTYILNQPVSTPDSNYGAPGSGTYGLVKDTLANNGCAQPCAPGGSCSAPLTNPVEMLSDNMRLSQFLVCGESGSSNLYTVNVTVSYGNSGSLDVPSGPVPTCASPSFTAPTCSGGDTQSQQFCAVSSLSTSVYAGLAI